MKKKIRFDSIRVSLEAITFYRKGRSIFIMNCNIKSLDFTKGDVLNINKINGSINADILPIKKKPGIS